MLAPFNLEVNEVRELTIVVTNKCDLKCTFCGGVSYMSEDESSLENRLSDIGKIIDANPELSYITWSGGEPLLKTKHLDAMIDLVKRRLPNATNSLYTNGLSLSKTDNSLLNKFDEIFISFDGFRKSERPLKAVVAGGDFSFFEKIGQLNSKLYVWSVMTREQLGDIDWFKDVADLHQALFNYNIQDFRLIFDNDMPKPLSTDHLLNFIAGYEQLVEGLGKMSWTSGTIKKLYVNKFFKKYCDECMSHVQLSTSGKVFQRETPEAFLDEGCVFLSKAIGPDAYTYINNYLHAMRMEDAPENN